MHKLFDYADSHGLEVTGPPFEMCHIDGYETSEIDEYTAEIQLPVR